MAAWKFVDGGIYWAARQLILEQEGAKYLYGDGLTPYADFESFLQHGPDSMYPTAIEAVLLCVDKWDTAHQYGGFKGEYSWQLADAINEIFGQERVGWKIVDGEMVAMESQELHEAVVEPALRLLHESRFAKVDATYRKALDELSKGDCADAVTDAGTALQELLTQLCCEGNQLGDLIKSARKRHLLAAHDTPVLDAIEKALNLVAADRSETGESHHASDASRDDAWLIVHIVGAFIVRLATGEQRKP